MTAVSAVSGGPVRIEGAPTTAKKGGIDYSKFNNIDDSDDEPAAVQSKTATKESEEEKPHCHNCHKPISKPLRCGICKQVSYCSQACQKDDWPFHKRLCKKPEMPKAPEKRRPKSVDDEDLPGKKTEKVVVDDEEIPDWYRHREWKPSAEPKKEFVPTQINGQVLAADAQAQAKGKEGSAWNAAGTWEETDASAQAQRALKEVLGDLPQVDAATGAVVLEVVDSVEGDASHVVVQGRMRHIFDMTIKIKFLFRYQDAGGQQKAAGTLTVRDFTNDTSMDGVGDGGPPVVELSGLSSLDAARRQAVEAAVGRGSWPPVQGTFLANVAERMQAWSRSFQQLA